jgi:hypothetical protein
MSDGFAALLRGWEVDPCGRRARSQRSKDGDSESAMSSSNSRTELLWRTGPAVDSLPILTLRLTQFAGVTVDFARAALASLSSSAIDVATAARRSGSPRCHPTRRCSMRGLSHGRKHVLQHARGNDGVVDPPPLS